ncbi:MAG: radical SAM protein [Elusimicrobiota bacterium]|nr:radical SAM protein [Elusimicrobiota bacterium]
MRSERLLVLVLTRRCDRNCGYCPQGFEDADMSEGVVDAALDLLPLLPPGSRVKLFGGEPLLRPDLVARALGRLPPGTAVELPTHGKGLPAVESLLARRPEVEVFVSRPDPWAARLRGVVHNFLIPPGEAPAATARRLAQARLLGYARFNFLPAYFVSWSPAQVEGLAAAFAGLRLVLGRWADAGRPVEVVNLSRLGSTPLYNDGLVVDTDGEVYSSNLVLAEAVRPHRRRLRLGEALDPGGLAARPAADAQAVLSESYPPEILSSMRAVDDALTVFCLALGAAEAR